MRPISVGINPNLLRGSPVLDAQVLAATPLGKDSSGANLTAYIVRSDEEAPLPRAKNLANANDTSAPAAANFSETLNVAEQNATPQETSAKFIKPDSLLSRLEKAQVDQLRARDVQIKKETAEAKSAGTPSFVYQTGPDGKKYIVGVATPLMLQNPDEGAEDPDKPKLSEQEHDRGIAAYQTRLGTASPLRAGSANQIF